MYNNYALVRDTPYEFHILIKPYYTERFNGVITRFLRAVNQVLGTEEWRRYIAIFRWNGPGYLLRSAGGLQNTSNKAAFRRNRFRYNKDSL